MESSTIHRRNFIIGNLWPALVGYADVLDSGRLGVRASEINAGFAESDITPSIGMERPGNYFKVRLTTYHDPCKARAAVYEDGQKRIALVGTDSLLIPRRVVLAARRRISAECGIAPEAILVGASHSHTSGPVGMVLPGEYDDASPLVRDLAYNQSSMADAGYLKRVEDGIVAAVVEAFGARVPALTGFGAGQVTGISFNRRFRMKNGLTYTHPGQGNTNTVAPAGPIDPVVSVITSWSGAGKTLGCIVNYACHGTTGPEGISANWIYYMQCMLRNVLGPETPVVFLQGFCGDITQVDNQSPYKQPTQDEWGRLVGGSVGAEALKVMCRMTRGDAAPLDFRTKTWSMPRRLPSPAHVQRALQIVKSGPEKVGRTNWIFAKETVMLDALGHMKPEVEIEVQALQLGPAVFVSAPGEMFCEFGLRLRAASKFPLTCPVELANGSVGYVPTRAAFGPNGGGYETRLTSYSNLKPQAGDEIAAAEIELMNDLKPGKLPEPPPARPFNHKEGGGLGPSEWDYGNVPPELD